MDAFDADVLIYAAEPGHPLGGPVRDLFIEPRVMRGASPAGIGSVLLVPEVLSKPHRLGSHTEAAELVAILDCLDLRAVDRTTADLATAVGARYGLRAMDAVHLATAIAGGADRFITNNSKDFTPEITEITVVGPQDLR